MFDLGALAALFLCMNTPATKQIEALTGTHERTPRRVGESEELQGKYVMFFKLFALYGYSVVKTAEAIGVHRSTVLRWKREHDDFRELLEQARDEAFACAEVSLSRIISRWWDIINLDPLEAYEFGLQVQSQLVKTGKGGGVSLESVRASLAGIPPHIRRLMRVSFNDKGVLIEFPSKDVALQELSKLHQFYTPQERKDNLTLEVISAPTSYPEGIEEGEYTEVE